MDIDHDNDTIMFAHDGKRIYYPCGPGRVYSIRFIDLDMCDGSNGGYAVFTVTGDLGSMLLRHHVPEPLDLRAKAPHAWVDCGNFDDDLSDAVEQWADYCDRLAAEEDGEAADLERIVERAA